MEPNKQLPYPFLRNCAEILFNYTGEIPFHLYLKQEFKKNPAWGGRDRKNYRSYCYLFWRIAKPSDRDNIENIIQWLRSAEISTKELNEINPLTGGTDKPKLNTSTIDLKLNDEFWDGYPALSKSLQLANSKTTIPWNDWYRQEAPVWIKVVSIANFQSVISKINALGLQPVSMIPEIGAIALPGQSNINSLEQEGSIIIQDLSSQKSMVLYPWIESNILNNDSGMSMVWDACCGAGGKSLSLRINYPRLDIQCSDIRQGILDNCIDRFSKTGLEIPFVFKHNLANSANKKTKFKIVLADIPCSGSGTWRRNPEEKWFFDSSHWESMVETQFSMVNNAALSVADGGYLVVCTCSIFARENETLIERLLNHFNSQHSENNVELMATWKVLDQQFIGGWENNADYIFRTILKKTTI